ncbi:hypothetical protein BDW22DRAFT_1034794 [Trametopsis cervina]|nr:hypothetical protein BDW22DRAFT_1034794 [Trametopsis cervina]
MSFPLLASNSGYDRPPVAGFRLHEFLLFLGLVMLNHSLRPMRLKLGFQFPDSQPREQRQPHPHSPVGAPCTPGPPTSTTDHRQPRRAFRRDERIYAHLGSPPCCATLCASQQHAYDWPHRRVQYQREDTRLSSFPHSHIPNE